MINKHSGIHVVKTLDHSQYGSRKVVSRTNLWDNKSYKLERESQTNNSISKQALYKKNNNLIIIKRRIKIKDIWAITYSY